MAYSSSIAKFFFDRCSLRLTDEREQPLSSLGLLVIPPILRRYFIMSLMSISHWVLLPAGLLVHWPTLNFPHILTTILFCFHWRFFAMWASVTDLDVLAFPLSPTLEFNSSFFFIFAFIFRKLSRDFSPLHHFLSSPAL